MSGRFDSTRIGWSMAEKELHAVVATLDRMHRLIATPDGFQLFTDQNNLIFLFGPLSVVSDLCQTSLLKVLRWAIRLSTYAYTYLHIKGSENVWEDLLRRWSAPLNLGGLVSIPEPPSSSADDFVCTTSGELRDAPTESESNKLQGLSPPEGLFRNPNGRIWIPNDAMDVQL